MKFTKTNVLSTPEILKRLCGGELFVPVTLATASFTNGVCKAGTPIGADGTITNTASVKGILLNDVYADDPNGSLIVAFATINENVAEAHCGLTYEVVMKNALSKIVFD